MPQKEQPRKIITTQNYWPTPIWHTHVQHFNQHPTKVSFNEDIINYVSTLKETQSVNKSNIGGWQSELLDPFSAELKPLSDEIIQMASALQLKWSNISIVQMWINSNRKGDYNTIHQHGQYHISGTYYVKTPENSGNIVFRDPRDRALSNTFLIKSGHGIAPGGEILTVTVGESLLMLWPSYLDHFVQPSKTEDERISISFDIMNR